MGNLNRRTLSLRRFAQACRVTVSAMGVSPEVFRYGDQIRWIIGFVVGCSVLVGVTLFILWALTGFVDLGVSGHGLVALILGVLFTSGLGIALMALIFYSNRSGHREDIHRTDADVKRDAKET